MVNLVQSLCVQTVKAALQILLTVYAGQCTSLAVPDAAWRAVPVVAVLQHDSFHFSDFILCYLVLGKEI